jgi:phospho-N-acetylmuramoyl-pentapeptide-transferase
VINILLSGGIALVLSLAGTPLLIRFLVAKSYGQFIRDDGPTTHQTKRGTPTMGGIVIILATLIGFLAASFGTGSPPSMSGWLMILIMAGMGLVGFLDDAIKITRQRSLGLTPTAKLIGQFAVGTAFALLSLIALREADTTAASTAISFTRDTVVDFARLGPVVGTVLFAIWVNLISLAWSNAVNLTDGLDGLATGASILFFLSYVLITFWQWRQGSGGIGIYGTAHPLELACFAAAVVGACIGFLWYNTSPAKIFMGDTGSLALGGAIAGMTILSRTELLGAVIGGLFVIITLSVVLQVGSFKLTGKRVFRMAPLQHHFELMGWGEVTIVVRFWIVAGLFAIAGLGIFYVDALL